MNNSYPIVTKSGKAFSLPTDRAVTTETRMPVTYIPQSGDKVISITHDSSHLLNVIGSGGEGSVYTTDNGMACKIYFEDKITRERYEKLKLMLSNPINHPGICWPQYLTYNEKREFVGYSMKRAKGKPLQTSLFIKDEFTKNFPYWTKEHLVTLSLNILEIIIQLHQKNVIIGDLNAMNILIENEYEVYFVDTDSYQIERYPCPVGTDYFTAPEIQGEDFRTFLRTFNAEYFAVANLLFMLLFCGKPPYSKQGGATPAENIRMMDFPYPLAEKTNQKVPAGQWIYMWNHFPFYIKDAFYDVFKHNIRKSPQEWFDLLGKYKRELSSGHGSVELFPDRFKRPTKKVVCSICKRHFDEGEGYVQKLKRNNSNLLCPTCGQMVKQLKRGVNLSRQNISKQREREGIRFNNLDIEFGNDLLDQFFETF